MNKTNENVFPGWEYLFDDAGDALSSHKKQRESKHRQRILKFENSHLLKGLEFEGPLEMPKASPMCLDTVPEVYVPFNCLNAAHGSHVCVHFYIHDYLFKRIWGGLEEYLEHLARYDAVIATDDSVFMDVPLVANLCSVYRNRLFTAVGQRMGVNVIPSFSCGNPRDIDIYCDGLPEGGCIAVGGMGTNRTHAQRSIFRYCVRAMCARKHPDMLLVYGSDVDLGLNVPVVHIPTFVEQLRKRA